MHLRLLLVIPSLAAGGAERVLSLLASEWARRGHRVVLTTLAPADQDFFDLDPRVERIGLALATRPRGVDWITVNADRIRRLRHLIRSSQSDVVVSFLDAANLLTLLAASGTRAPVVVSQRTDPALHPIKRSHRLLRRLLYGRATALVVQTAAVAEWASTLTGHDKVVVIPNPVMLVDSGGSSRRPMIAGVGRLDRPKGFDLLIEAFASIADAHPEWSVAIAGAGPELDRLVEQAARLGVGERIEFRGLTPDPRTLFAESSLFVLSSRSEGFPNVVLEALASGLPVIASDCSPGVNELLRDGAAGVLVPRDDVESLAIAMARLMRDADERDRLAIAARRAVKRFELSSIADRWQALFESVLDGR